MRAETCLCALLAVAYFSEATVAFIQRRVHAGIIAVTIAVLHVCIAAFVEPPELLIYFGSVAA